MATGPEQNLYKSLKATLPKGTFCQRIENRAGTGVPDVYLVLDGQSLFLELKVGKVSRFAPRPSQLAWNASHSLSGGRSAFLLRDASSSRLFLFSALYGLPRELPKNHVSSTEDRDSRAPIWSGELGELVDGLRTVVLEPAPCALRP